MTHYEQIKAMSIEEMVETLYNWNCPPKLRNCPDPGDCRQCWLDWLKQEATDE